MGSESPNHSYHFDRFAGDPGAASADAQDQAQAQEEPPRSTPAASANYNFLVGSRFLCGADDSTACPAAFGHAGR